MKKYEYKFVRVNKITGLRARNGDTYKQVVTPFNEVINLLYPSCYQIIFEREK